MFLHSFEAERVSKIFITSEMKKIWDNSLFRIRLISLFRTQVPDRQHAAPVVPLLQDPLRPLRAPRVRDEGQHAALHGRGPEPRHLPRRVTLAKLEKFATLTTL